MVGVRRTSVRDQANAKMRERLVVSFEDNGLVRDLLGQYDANLAMIEDRIGVEAIAHGNIVTIVGSEDGIQLAKTVLEGLYARLAEGEVIGPGDVDGAIRNADAGHHVGKTRGKAEKSKKKSPRRHSDAEEAQPTKPGAAQIRTRKRLITARSPMQSKYIETMEAKELTFATGPAGTGKTYLAVAYAAACLERGETERLILSRPAVEAGERLGFLPGDMREKVDPYLRPLYDGLYDVLPAEKVERGLESGVIEIAPLAFMRGRTLSHAMVILDEAQNCTHMQMKMFLTRLGEDSKMIVTGDPTQIDLPEGQKSGLVEAIHMLRKVKGIGRIAFTGKDVVRHDLVTRIVEAYEKASK